MNDFFKTDPMLSAIRQEQGQLIEEYRRRIEAPTRTGIWDKIDSEVSSLTDKQKEIVQNDEDYKNVNTELSAMVQSYLLNLIKPQIEANENGRKLLEKVYDAVVLAKKKAVNDTEKKMKLFEQFELYSVKNPKATYEDFINELNKKK